MSLSKPEHLWRLEPFPDLLTPECDRWVVHGLRYDRVQLDSTHEADARLIAAAPTLLRALTDAIEFVRKQAVSPERQRTLARLEAAVSDAQPSGGGVDTA